MAASTSLINYVITDLLLRDDLFQGTSSCLFSINLKTLTQEDLLTDIYNKEHPFSILFEPETLSSKTLSGICMYFDFTFFHQHPHERHTVSTKERTHWNHTLFHFDSDRKLQDLEDEKAIWNLQDRQENGLSQKFQVLLQL